jgi:DEAD/DEAH box helicase domain-containing protein
VDIGDPARDFVPTVYLYDNYPGGIGLSTPLYDLRGQVVAGARSLVDACACARGCPACVGPILASDESREHSPKAAALAVIELLVESDSGRVIEG